MRPKILDDAAKQRIIEATRKGLTRAVCAGLAGVSETTLYKYLREDAQFAQEVKTAQRLGEEELVDVIRMHSVKSWQAAAWLLERRYPERFGQRQKVQHEVKQMSEEQAKAKFKELTGLDWKAA